MDVTNNEEFNEENKNIKEVENVYLQCADVTSCNTEPEHDPKNETKLWKDLEVEDRIKATIYGQCIGDAIGLLTEFMTMEEAKMMYGEVNNLEYEHKVNDEHRERWEQGDWTDDTDQMILIMDSLLENKGEVAASVFATKLINWLDYGFRELGDKHGSGVGAHTCEVLEEINRLTQCDPLEISRFVWEKKGCVSAPNGGVMRTSIMGIHQFWDVDKVVRNAEKMCQITHFDPRCVASAVAVSVAISLMLRRQHYKNGEFDVNQIIDEAFNHSICFLVDDSKIYISELKDSMDCEDISKLKLSGDDKIGYTFKCLGAGFWALKQNDFRNAIQTITMCGGDADTNGAVAGALLGCKLGMNSLPDSWISGLKHKLWLDEKIERLTFLNYVGLRNANMEVRNVNWK